MLQGVKEGKKRKRKKRKGEKIVLQSRPQRAGAGAGGQEGSRAAGQQVQQLGASDNMRWAAPGDRRLRLGLDWL